MIILVDIVIEIMFDIVSEYKDTLYVVYAALAVVSLHRIRKIECESWFVAERRSNFRNRTNPHAQSYRTLTT